jgi:hypothetical protein
VILRGKKRHRLYFLEYKGIIKDIKTSLPVTLSKKTDLLTLWHKRLGHYNVRDIVKTYNKHSVRGLTLNRKNIKKSCDTCAIAKMNRKKTKFFEKKKNFAVGEELHSDIITLPVSSRSGYKYQIFFICGNSRYCLEYLMKTRKNIHQYFQRAVTFIKKQKSIDVKKLRCDNEYITSALMKYAENLGIKIEPCPPYEKNFNGIAERYNRKIRNMIRVLLHQAKLPKYFWAEASKTSVYTLNRCITKGNGGKTPYEMWHGTKPNISHMRIFGCEAYAKISLPQDALSETSELCLLLGYNENQNTYRLLSLQKQGVIRDCRTVEFIEDNQTPWKDNNPAFQYEDDKTDESETEQDNNAISNAKSDENESENDDDSLDSSSVSDKTLRRSKRRKQGLGIQKTSHHVKTKHTVHSVREWMSELGIKEKHIEHSHELKTDMIGPLSFAATVKRGEQYIPQTYKDAITCPDAKHWIIAIETEMNNLISMGTWKEVPLKKGVKPVQCKWVFAIKMKDGKPHRYKARLVVKGYTQKKGIDYHATFSPVAHAETVKTLLTEAFMRNMKITQIDVTAAFLNGDIDVEIFMKHPKGMVPAGLKTTLQLLKSLYGLKQASRVWHRKLCEWLLTQNCI